MKVISPDRLDDSVLLEAADPGGMLRQVASSAAQVRTAMRAASEADLAGMESAGRPRAVVVTGMGGSGVAGEVLAAVCGTGCPVQILAVHGYQLPGWVGATDLVISVSCSGSTEETLSAAAEAVRRGCRVIGVGGAGSPLAMLAEQARAPFVPVRSAGMPRSTLWGLSIPLVMLAARLGIVEMAVDDFESAATVLERISHLCRPDSDSFVNPAKSLALELAGCLPVIWGTSLLTGVVASRFACQLNENAKYPAVAGVLPEANHNQVVTFDGPFAPASDARAALRSGLGGGRPGPLAGEHDGDGDGAGDLGSPGQSVNGAGPDIPLRLVLLRDSREHPQVARRREVSARLAAERGIEVTELAAEGDRPLERLASLIQLIDYATVYLAIASGVDPAPVTAIQELKAQIA